MTLAIGGTTIEELQTRMSHAEFVAWAAFAEVEPLPGARADLHTAMLMHLTASVHRSKRSKKVKLKDLLPDWWQDARSPRVLEAKLRALAASWGQEGNNTSDSDEKERLDAQGVLRQRSKD